MNKGYNREPFTPEQKKLWDAFVKKTLEAASGNWAFVIGALVPELVDVIEVGPDDHTWCPNPRHTQRNGDAMRVYDDFDQSGGMVCNCCGYFPSGVRVLRWWHDWGFGETIKKIAETLNIPAFSLSPTATTHGAQAQARQPARTAGPPAPTRVQEDPAKQDARKVAQLVEVSNQSIALDDPAAVVGRTYLENRGIVPLKLPIPELRFHPNLPLFRKVPIAPGSKKTKSELVGHFPALVYLVRTPTGERGSVHRTYLRPDGTGKADVPKQLQKKLMPRPSYRPLTGGACHLDPTDGPFINIAEGLETALTVRLLTGLPTWCSYSGGLLEAFDPPEHIRFVAVWGDYDANGYGEKAANALVKRLRARGLRAVAIFPHYALEAGDTKIDWNDALRRYGLEALRKQAFFTTFMTGLAHRMDEAGLLKKSAG